jgi:hypothetical protein
VVATCFGLCGLATCFGAWTVMLGSEVAKPVAVCDIAVPLGPHNNAVDRMATAEGATKLDDNLMTCPSQIRDGNAVPRVARYHTFRIGPPRIEKLSADDSPSTWPQENADRSLKAVAKLVLAQRPAQMPASRRSADVNLAGRALTGCRPRGMARVVLWSPIHRGRDTCSVDEHLSAACRLPLSHQNLLSQHGRSGPQQRQRAGLQSKGQPAPAHRPPGQHHRDGRQRQREPPALARLAQGRHQRPQEGATARASGRATSPFVASSATRTIRAIRR